MNIRPYAKNAKKHPKKQIEQIANSIKEFGMNQPIVVDKEGVIIVGHGRYEALKLLGREPTEDEIKVVDLTVEQAKAYRLADNKLNESDWEMDLVIEELKGLSEDLVELTGFDNDLLIEPEERDDQVPETPTEPRSKLGDLYELGEHRVLCGDSTKLEDVERLMDRKKADMVFTDPPYGIDLLKNGQSLGKSKAYSAVIGDGEEYEPTHLFQWAKDVFTWGANHYAHKLPASPCWIVWDKQGGAKHNTFADCELAWCSKRMPARCITHVWDGFRRDSEKGVERSHPTQKPVQLLIDCMIQVKAPNLLLDLFLGSGSTLIAAEKTGRICYGMELDPRYIDVIVQRYVDYTGNTTIKLNGQEITWEKTAGKQQK